MERRNLTIAVIIIIIVVVVGAVAAFQYRGAGKPEEEEKVVTFGASLSLTGKYSRNGEYTKRGYEMWVDLVNEQGGLDIGGEKYEVELMYYDDESSTERASKLVSRLITEDKVDFLLGPYSSTLGMPTSAQADKYKVPMVLTGSASDKIYEQGFKYVVGSLTPATHYEASLVRMVAAKGAETMCVLHEDTLFPTSVAEGGAEVAEDEGIEILSTKKYTRGAETLKPIISTFKELNPDVVLMGCHLKDSLLFTKEAREADFNAEAFIFSVGPNMPDYRNSLPVASQYMFSATQWHRAEPWEGPVFGSAMDFAEMYKDEYGDWPDYHVAEAAAAGVMYQLVLEDVGTLDREEVNDALHNFKGETFFGPMEIDPETGKDLGHPMAGIQVQELKEGEDYPDTAIVAPPEVAQVEPVYPRPTWTELRE